MDVKYTAQPRLWDPSGHLGNPDGELQPHDTDGDKYYGCGILQELTGIFFCIIEGCTHRGPKRAGEHGIDHEVEA